MNEGAQRGGKYLQEWHNRHPGASSAMLGSLADEVGHSSYEVLAEALRHEGGEPVLDLACGDGHLLGLLRTNQVCLGADWSPAELSASFRGLGQGVPLIRADARGCPSPLPRLDLSVATTP